MKPTDRIAELVDAATAGLKDDAELRFDVRAELLSHIRDKAESLRAEGKSKEESLELACKSFGPATEVAGALVEANRRRMKLRAVARLFLRAVVVPAAVAAALLVIAVRADRYPATFEGLRALFRHAGSTQPDTFKLPPAPLCLPDNTLPIAAVLNERLDERKRFLLWGDTTRDGFAEQYRAIWEAHPESKAYYANYIMHLAEGYDYVDPTFLESEVRRGEELDPDNALYNYLLAGVFAERSIDWKRLREKGKEENGLSLVKDRALMDRAIGELRKAGLKPYLRSYRREIVREQLALLPPARRLEEGLAMTGLVEWGPVAHLVLYPPLIRALPRYAEILLEEGRAGEAEALLECWYPFVRKAAADSFTPEDLIYAGDVIPSIVEEEWPPLYEKLGRPKKAEVVRRRAQHIRAPVEESVAKFASASREFRKGYWRSAPIHATRFLSYIPQEASHESLAAPGRFLEHTLLEQVFVPLLLLLLLVMISGTIAATARWRFLPGASSAPILLVPPWRTMLRILGLTVLLPLFAFYVYTRWSGLAGREYSLIYLWPRFVLELILLMVTMLGLAVSVSTRAVRERCRSLDVPVPPRGAERYRFLFWVVLGVIWAACLFARGKAADWPAIIAAGAVICFLLLYGLFALVRLTAGPAKYGLFYGTLARSFTAILAATAILIGAVSYPYLTNLETVLVRSDPSLTVDSELPNMNRPEADVVRMLKAQLRDAFAEIDTEKEGAHPEPRAEGGAGTE